MKKVGTLGHAHMRWKSLKIPPEKLCLHLPKSLHIQDKLHDKQWKSRLLQHDFIPGHLFAHMGHNTSSIKIKAAYNEKKKFEILQVH